MFPLLIIVLLVAVAALVVSRCVRVINEGEQAVVLRLGRFDRVIGPGLAFIPPFLDEHYIVATAPRHVAVAAAGFTRDGVRASVRVALVARVTKAPLVLRHGRSLEQQATDAVATVAASAIGQLSVVDLVRGGDDLVQLVRASLVDQLAAIGLGVDSLRVHAVQLPPEVTSVLASVVLAVHRHESAEIAAQTARLVRTIGAQADAERLSLLDRSIRKVDDRTLAFERWAAVRAVAEHGGQVNIVTGLDDGDVRPAIALPPPRLREAS